MATPTVVLFPIWAAGHLMSMVDTGKAAARPERWRPVADGARDAAADGEGEVRDRRRHTPGAGSFRRHARRHPLPSPPRRGSLKGLRRRRRVNLHADHVKAAISSLTCPVAAVVLEFFATTLFDVCRRGDLPVPAYVYFTSDAAFYALLLRLPALHEEVAVEFGDMEGTVDVPGLPPVPPSSLPVPVMDKTSPNYTWFVYHGKRFREADGVVINTVAELEQGVLAAIADGTPTVYPVGPVLSLPSGPRAGQPHECVRWLDAQPRASVVLLCFGSRGFFTATQAHQVALGPERSGHRFLWVLRGPPAAGSVQPTDANFGELLPEGFLERTDGKGLVWPTKAPQKEILAHAAVGGFVTHCGWNSTPSSTSTRSRSSPTWEPPWPWRWTGRGTISFPRRSWNGP